MDRTKLLISDYLDCELAADEVELLAKSLREDSAWIDWLVLHSFIHWQLSDWMMLGRVQDEILVGAIRGTSGHARSAGWENNEEMNGRSTTRIPLWPRSSATSTRRSWLRTAATIAATILVGASLATVGYFIASRPVNVAQLSHCSGAKWDGADIPVGTLLESSQELRLKEGRALLTFVSGVQVTLEGPTTVRLDSAHDAYLADGRITTKVPLQAIGFTINCSLAHFVDLGTEFTVKMESGGCELHVFDGLVELRLNNRFGDAASKPVRVPEFSAVRVDAERGDVAKVPYDEGQRISL